MITLLILFPAFERFDQHWRSKYWTRGLPYSFLFVFSKYLFHKAVWLRCLCIGHKMITIKKKNIFFSVRLLLVLRGHFFFFLSQPQRPMTSDFSIPDFIHYIYFPILIFEKEPVFPFLMFSAKQVNYWYHIYMFKTSRDFDSFHALLTVL